MKSSIVVDTLPAYTNLRKAEFEEKQARTLISSLLSLTDDAVRELATKQDVNDVRNELKQDIKDIRNEIKGLEASFSNKFESLEASNNNRFESINDRFELLETSMKAEIDRKLFRAVAILGSLIVGSASVLGVLIKFL